jgi:hypothetical protein
MSITVHDELIKRLQYSHNRVVVDKASLANQLTTAWTSMWTATGTPGTGAAPGAIAVCTQALTGALPLTNRTSPEKNYITFLEATCGNTLTNFEIHDRLVHMGGLATNVNTSQNVLIDLSTLLATSNLDERKGDANYSDVQWWIESYTDGGSTTVNLTINAKFNDGTDANLTVLSLPRFRAGQSYPLNGLIAAAQAGSFIRGINTVTLSATTGGAGSWGVTATRYRTGKLLPISNAKSSFSWYELGLPDINNSSCLSIIVLPSTTSSGLIRASVRISNG